MLYCTQHLQIKIIISSHFDQRVNDFIAHQVFTVNLVIMKTGPSARDFTCSEPSEAPFSCIHIHYISRPAEQVRQTQRPPDQCFGWDGVADPSLVGKIHAHHHHKFVPTRTSWSERKRELWRPENKQIVSAEATHSWPALHLIGSSLDAKQKPWLAFVCMPKTTEHKICMDVDANQIKFLLPCQE